VTEDRKESKGNLYEMPAPSRSEKHQPLRILPAQAIREADATGLRKRVFCDLILFPAIDPTECLLNQDKGEILSAIACYRHLGRTPSPKLSGFVS
jgi:hypothetical protein